MTLKDRFASEKANVYERLRKILLVRKASQENLLYSCFKYLLAAAAEMSVLLKLSFGVLCSIPSGTIFPTLFYWLLCIVRSGGHETPIFLYLLSSLLSC